MFNLINTRDVSLLQAAKDLADAASRKNHRTYYVTWLCDDDYQVSAQVPSTGYEYKTGII